MIQTGYKKADRVLDRLNSSDPDFDDCANAAALIFELVADRGPDGALWKDVAFDERVKRAAAEAEIARLTAELAGLRAARMAYASEFPLDAEGEPDVGSIHQNIRARKAKLAAMRQHVDEARAHAQAVDDMAVGIQAELDDAKERERVLRSFLEVMKGVQCPYCDNDGWYVVNHGGQPEQEQCEWCYTFEFSIFNVKRAALGEDGGNG